MVLQYRKITFLGAGNMARAMITGLVNAGYPASLISVCAPSALNRDALAEQFGITSSHDNVGFSQHADVIVLAVKPQIMADVCQLLRTNVNLSNKLILSIAAGISLARFDRLLGARLSLIRIMPNSPAMAGEGMSGLFASPGVSLPDRDFTSALMSTTGRICWLDSEEDINIMTAAAGSAPAYFFLFMDAIQQEAQHLGFTAKTARLVVQQTVSGVAAVVAANPDMPLSTLCAQVTSAGGTTAEALRVFHEQKLADTVSKAMRAVMTRAQEMEKLF